MPRIQKYIHSLVTILVLFFAKNSSLLASNNSSITDVPVFNSYIKVNGVYKFSLSDKSRTSSWRTLEQNYLGFEIISFEEEKKALVVRNKGEYFKLFMQNPRKTKRIAIPTQNSIDVQSYYVVATQMPKPLLVDNIQAPKQILIPQDIEINYSTKNPDKIEFVSREKASSAEKTIKKEELKSLEVLRNGSKNQNKLKTERQKWITDPTKFPPIPEAYKLPGVKMQRKPDDKEIPN